MNVTTLWRTTLERLETAPVDAVCKAWLLSANLASTWPDGVDDIDADSFSEQDELLYFILQVPSTLARDVINTRWRRSIEDILADITGQPVAISVTNAHDEPAAPGREVNSRYPAARNHQTSDFTYYDFPPKSPIQHDLQDLQFRGPASFEHLEEWDNEQRANVLMHNRLNPRYTFEAFI